MNWIIWAGKLITVCALALMGYNLMAPFGGNISMLLNILLGITALMHLMQLAVFHVLFSKLMPLKGSDYVNVFAFGVFALLEYRAKALAQYASEARRV